ncbi:hypothetical protein CAEBREN_02852 [Caenorhabditis brenneri]|uniref:Uncharacterized protein n=1 Tax=Caenorhabditis brenneri TaxID=135651 RepID=G0NFP2_CAEBE|nr:hypothetical protein CAEBREN_02852 [Caenorhabditis brenneri]
MNLLSKLFFNSQSRDEKNEKTYIIKGYPLTSSPVIPDILKHRVEFRTINDNYGLPILGLTLAHEGADLVEPECLEVIRKRMFSWFKHHSEPAKYFEKELPRNLIAISFAQTNFQMGKESCHDFKLANGYKEAENSFYTYRKLSESVQCVYYNENGVEYIALGCFYPAPYGKPKLLESNEALVHYSMACRIPYPLVDRMKSFNFVTQKFYGRYCATAGKSVVVTCASDDGIPRHWEYNHVANKYEINLCKECLEDFYTYEWKEPKKDTPAAPATESASTIPVGVEEASAAPIATGPAPVTSDPAPASNTDSDLSPITRAGSTESLIEGFEQVTVGSADVESDIEAELID